VPLARTAVALAVDVCSPPLVPSCLAAEDKAFDLGACALVLLDVAMVFLQLIKNSTVKQCG
jgi:hypothetical protein